MSRGYRDNDSKRYFDWLYYAHIDLLAANELMEQPLCYNTVAFHCQQAIEKAIKGYLLYRRHRLYKGCCKLCYIHEGAGGCRGAGLCSGPLA